MFPHLFTPLRIGRLELRNRIVSSGHDTGLADAGLVGDRLVAYHEARAAGGVGLIVTQAAVVHTTARYSSDALLVNDDSCIPGLRRLADATRHHGAAIVGQLFHPGREVAGSFDGSRPVAVAPSSTPNERFHVVPRAMTLQMIADVVAAYGTAARRFAEAGFDGVEVVANHGKLPAQFMNPRVNLRTDRYGGSDENRLRFLREVIEAIRREVGPGTIVGLRISIDEMAHEGLSPEESLAALVALNAERRFDYLSVVAGSTATLAGADHVVPTMAHAPGYIAPLSARAKTATGVPVMVAGRIIQPQEAERLIASGHADACVMTRAMICDPIMPTKARDGRVDEIRACVGCNQACIGHYHKGHPISCIQYPESGRELEYGRARRTTRGRKVLVVGGGPAGLKAASVAAERGHNVSLFESASRVGGQVLLAEKIPGRSEFGGVVTNLLGEARRAGVEIVTEVQVDASFVGAQRPDVVIVATGAVPYAPVLELAGRASVVTAWEVLLGAAVPPGRVVVADWACDWIGLGVADLLARRGNKVTLAVNGYMAGQSLPEAVRNAMLAAAARARVEVLPNVRPFGYDGSTAFLQHVLTDDAVEIEDVAAVVLAQGHRPVVDLLDSMGAFAGECHAIGDCLAPRSVEEAVLEGLRVGSVI